MPETKISRLQIVLLGTKIYENSENNYMEFHPVIVTA